MIFFFGQFPEETDQIHSPPPPGGLSFHQFHPEIDESIKIQRILSKILKIEIESIPTLVRLTMVNKYLIIEAKP